MVCGWHFRETAGVEIEVADEVGLFLHHALGGIEGLPGGRRLPYLHQSG
jgi:hypothetical protein